MCCALKNVFQRLSFEQNFVPIFYIVDDFDLEIKREFINEALMNLEEAEGSFMELESSDDPKPLLDKIFRLAHNLKGGSRAVGFGDVAEFTHQLENLVQKIQRDEVPLSGDVITTLLRSNDRLIEMLSELKSNVGATFSNGDLLQEIQGWLEGTRTSSVSVVEPPMPTPTEALIADAPMAPVLSIEPEVTADVASDEIPSADAFFSIEERQPETVIEAPQPRIQAEEATPDVHPVPRSQEVKRGDDEVIRVNLSRIDMLNDYVGELIVLQSVVQQQASVGHYQKVQASLR